jgi:hypothetical protein
MAEATSGNGGGGAARRYTFAHRIRKEKDAFWVLCTSTMGSGAKTRATAMRWVAAFLFIATCEFFFGGGAQPSSAGAALRPPPSKSPSTLEFSPFLDFVEVGTSSFNTLIGEAAARALPVRGASVEVLSIYLDQLPVVPGVAKLNFGVMGHEDHAPTVEAFFVHPFDLLAFDLDGYLAGCNSVGRPHATVVRELAARGLSGLLRRAPVRALSVAALFLAVAACRVGKVKFDVEGLDPELLVGYAAFLWRHPACFADVVLCELNELSTGAAHAAAKRAMAAVGYAAPTYVKEHDTWVFAYSAELDARRQPQQASAPDFAGGPLTRERLDALLGASGAPAGAPPAPPQPPSRREPPAAAPPDPCLLQAGALTFPLDPRFLQRAGEGGGGPSYAFDLCMPINGYGVLPPCGGMALAYHITHGADPRCYSLGVKRGAAAPARGGFSVDFLGGEPCGAQPRRVRVLYSCAEQRRFVSAEEDCGACCHTLRTEGPEGCPTSCARAASGAVCGGAGRGKCVFAEDGTSAACACEPGFALPGCATAIPEEGGEAPRDWWAPFFFAGAVLLLALALSLRRRLWDRNKEHTRT